MNEAVFREFDRLCRSLGVTGRVLELGASPLHRPLLELPSLAGASLRVGVGLDGPGRAEGHAVIRGNANELAFFRDESFDLVLCNAMIEHDPRFWLSVAEARRILKAGGAFICGAPGFDRRPILAGHPWLRRLVRRSPARLGLRPVMASAPTLPLHDFPGDYYRFSEQAMREVVLDGFEVVRVRTIMTPPRVIGVGRKPS